MERDTNDAVSILFLVAKAMPQTPGTMDASLQPYIPTAYVCLATKDILKMTLCMWPIHHQDHVLCGCTTFGTALN